MSKNLNITKNLVSKHSDQHQHGAYGSASAAAAPVKRGGDPTTGCCGTSLNNNFRHSCPHETSDAGLLFLKDCFNRIFWEIRIKPTAEALKNVNEIANQALAFLSKGKSS
jgi:hypothetical protein